MDPQSAADRLAAAGAPHKSQDQGRLGVDSHHTAGAVADAAAGSPSEGGTWAELAAGGVADAAEEGLSTQGTARPAERQSAS